MNRSTLMAMTMALALGRVLVASPEKELTQPLPEPRKAKPIPKRTEPLPEGLRPPKPEPSASLKRMLASKGRR